MVGFGRFFRGRNADTSVPPPTSPTQLKVETAAIVPPPAAAVPGLILSAVSPENLKSMQRMTDVIGILTADPESHLAMQKAVTAKDIPAFIEAVRVWSVPDDKIAISFDAKAGQFSVYDGSRLDDKSRLRMVSPSQMIRLMEDGFDPDRPGGINKVLSRHTEGAVEQNPDHARGAISRLQRAANMIESAEGARKEELKEIAGQLFDQAAKNQHFHPALMGDTKAANALREVLPVIGREPHQASRALAGVKMTADEKILFNLGASWQSQTPPRYLDQPPFPQQADADDQKLYTMFNYQKNTVQIANVTGDARDRLAIRDTLSAYAREADKENTPAFQVAMLTRLTALGIRGPKEIYPAAFQERVAAVTAKFAPPAANGGGPTAARNAARPSM